MMVDGLLGIDMKLRVCQSRILDHIARCFAPHDRIKQGLKMRGWDSRVHVVFQFFAMDEHVDPLAS
jgi:hypothetical protein